MDQKGRSSPLGLWILNHSAMRPLFEPSEWSGRVATSLRRSFRQVAGGRSVDKKIKGGEKAPVRLSGALRPSGPQRSPNGTPGLPEMGFGVASVGFLLSQQKWRPSPFFFFCRFGLSLPRKNKSQEDVWARWESLR